LDKSKKLSIAIIGAGGIGCYYGARLQDQGHQVKLVARGEHLNALQQSGLTLIHPEYSYQGEVSACTLEDLIKQAKPTEYDLILLCTKATSTKSIAKILKNWFDLNKQKTLILSLQNGIDNERVLADALGENCIVGGLAVRIGGHITSPGQIEATGLAQIIMGAWPSYETVANNVYHKHLKQVETAFNKADIPTQLVLDIKRELWRKLVINNGVNPLSALTGLDTKTLSHHPHFGKIVLGLMQEAARAATADNVELTDNDAQEMYQLIRDFDAIKTSMLVDMEKGKALELDAICGAVITRSKQLKIDVPYTSTIYALLKYKIEEKRKNYS